MEFESGQLYVLDYDSNIYKEPEDFFLKEEMNDFNINTCEYMIVLDRDFGIHFKI